MRKNSFQEGFSEVQCQKCWDKIGAASMMRACLSDKQILCTIRDADDETNLVMQELKNSNAASTFTLSMRSYRGDLRSSRCIEETLVRPITENHSLERLELLAKASTHGAKVLPQVVAMKQVMTSSSLSKFLFGRQQSSNWRIRRNVVICFKNR